MNARPADRLAIALAQLNPTVGDVAGNAEKVRRARATAAGQGADLVIFPELSLTGYVLQDLASTVARKPTDDDPVFKELLAASKQIDIVAGFVEED